MVANYSSKKIIMSIKGNEEESQSADKRKAFAQNSNSLKSSSLSMNHAPNEDYSPKSQFYAFNKKISAEQNSLKSEQNRKKINIRNIDKIKNTKPLIKLEEVQSDKEFTPRNDPRKTNKGFGFSNFVEEKNASDIIPQIIHINALSHKTVVNDTPRSKSMGQNGGKNKLQEMCNQLMAPKHNRRNRKSISEVKDKEIDMRKFKRFGSSSESLSSESSEMDFRYGVALENPYEFDKKGGSPARSRNPALDRIKKKEDDSVGSQGESAFSRNNVSIHVRNPGDVTTLFDDTPIIEGYRLVKQIGHGSFAKVYKAREEETMKEYVSFAQFIVI